MSWKRRRLSICLLGLLAGLGLAVACLYAYAGAYGINVLIRRGGSLWISVQPDDARLSASIRLALQQPALPAVAGVFQWQSLCTLPSGGAARPGNSFELGWRPRCMPGDRG
jgi:hypothetical protein